MGLVDGGCDGLINATLGEGFINATSKDDGGAMGDGPLS